jgi:predicted RNA binding protein YcfA (HicA-like mRNA interferase family)
VKNYSSKEVIRILESDGWYLSCTKGDHHQFKHPSKPGKTTVPHPIKNLGVAIIKSISKQSGIKF